MAENARVPRLAIHGLQQILESPRHSAIVRVTHWISALCFLALLLSGTVILLAHPRLYWGEAGNETIPALIYLPLPFIPHISLRGESRALHFLAAWLCVVTGLVYVISGALMRHFRDHLLPPRADFTWNKVKRHLQFRRPVPEEAESYNVVQRLTYLAVVFLLFPLAIWTGLAMSPGFTAVFPIVAQVFGGHQSARTVHCFVAFALVLFVLVHIVMVSRAGFRSRVRAMIAGGSAAGSAKVAHD